MRKLILEFERGGRIEATLDEPRAPRTCQAILDALPFETDTIHAMWAGEEIFFSNFPARFEYEQPTQDVEPGALAMVPCSSSFCIFYGRAIPRSAVDETIDVTVFGQVVDIPAMAAIGRRVRMRGAEKIRIRAGGQA
ncbi:MAG: DUF3830 family protein [Kiritimatiellae bacterium]|nr:DUF3830 family protein [Kiritimatiellia bacterium]